MGSSVAVSSVISQRICSPTIYSPKNLVEFARDYFAHLSEGHESTFLFPLTFPPHTYMLLLIDSCIRIASVGLSAFLADYESRQRPNPDLEQ